MEKILFILCFLFFTFMDFCKWIFSTAVKLLVYAVLNKTELKNGLNVIILFHFGYLRFDNYMWTFFFFFTQFMCCFSPITPPLMGPNSTSGCSSELTVSPCPNR